MSNAKKIIPREVALEISLDYGAKVLNCKCQETIAMSGRICDWCRQEQIRDFNYIENVLGMYEGSES